MSSETEKVTEAKALQFVKKIADHGIKGVPPLQGSQELAQEYLLDESYEDNEERADSLIRWEASKNFTSGFLTGLGGIITLPIAVPSALGASWIIQARLCGAIAQIYDHDLKEDRVRTLVILSLLGDAGKEVLKEAGVQIGQKITRSAISRIPGKVLIEINKKVGFRLLTKAGERGILNLTKVIPVVGGTVSGVFDATACIAVGKTAKNIFKK